MKSISRKVRVGVLKNPKIKCRLGSKKRSDMKISEVKTDEFLSGVVEGWDIVFLSISFEHFNSRGFTSVKFTRQPVCSLISYI